MKQANQHKNFITLVFIGLVFFGPMIAAWVLYNHPGLMAVNQKNQGELLASGTQLDPAHPLDVVAIKKATPDQPMDAQLIKASLSSEATAHPTVATTEVTPFAFLASPQAVDLKGHWWWLFHGGEANAMETIPLLNQMHKALHKSAPRVEKAILISSNTPRDPLKSLLQQVDTSFEVWQLPSEQSFPVSAFEAGDVLIVDPHGNIVLHHAHGWAPKAVLSDMKRLLHASRIG